MVIGKYLKVEQWLDIPGHKTHQWKVISARSGDMLGAVRWYGPWRQYTFQPESLTTFNRECLNDIIKFLDQVNAEHRAHGKK